ncbi:MAG: DUF5916 domain-containing protein [Longimicrobiales bacterium]
MSTRLRTNGVGVWVLVTLMLVAHTPTALHAQASVEETVRAALTALNAGDLDTFMGHFSPEARIQVTYAEDNGGGAEIAIDQVRAIVGKLTWNPGVLTTQVLGASAVTVVDLFGALPIPEGGTALGAWRYAELRTSQSGEWKITQVDISPRPLEGAVAIVGTPSQPSAAVVGSLGVAGPAAPAPAPAPRIARASSYQPAALPLPAGVPPAPVWPDLITRDDAGNATIRAVRLDGPIDVDGNLNEPAYAEITPFDDFIQALPDEGDPASELTEAWVMYDADNLYVSARVYEEVPESEWVANEMRRDATQVGNNENFGLAIDTFYDRRNAYFFYTNPLGAMVDAQITNEGNPNFDWNPLWDVRTGRFEGGWTVEMKLPFKSIRYQGGSAQLWGINLRRSIKRKNEWSQLTAVSRAAAGPTGRFAIIRMSRAATLVGLEVPPTGLSVDIKPYGIGSLTTDRVGTPRLENEPDYDGGIDLKWAVTQNLALDLTYNTDFAQVEVDEQQINLTRYSLTFPEKREFFLESRGIFNFPTTVAGGAGGAGGGSAPNLFFSRQIGLQNGRTVPILGGGRLTGKIGPFDVGALSIQTDEVQETDTLGSVNTLAELTNFTVLRARADVLGRSNIGALFARRSHSLVANGSNETYGADAMFAFFEDFYLSGFYARTQTRGVNSDNQSYQARVAWEGDVQGFSVNHLLVEDDFNPEVGLVRRSGFRQTQVNVRASPRPAAVSFIRQLTVEGTADYLVNARQGFIETRDLTGRLGVEFENSDQLTGSYSETYERLVRNERITGATIPAGRYSFKVMEASYAFGPQRFFSGTLSGRYGGFYDGDLTSVGFSRGRVEVFPQLSLEPSISHNWVRLPGQSFDTFLAASRITFTFTPRLFMSALMQYNSANDRVSANVRMRWEYRPGSELFLVYTEERDTFDFDRFPGLQNRGLVIKATSLVRF